MTVNAACTCGPSAAPVCTSMPLGMSTATTGAVDAGEHLGRVRPQRARAGDADDTVDHQIGCRRDAFDDRAAGARERGQGRLVGAFGIEQDRGGGRTAAAQERGRPQRVAAVVAGADHRADPAAGDPTGSRPSSRAIAVASPKAARRISAPSGNDASSGASASRIASAV